jgi:hypothetical protein
MSFKVRNLQLSNDALQVLNTLIEQDINASAAFKLTRILKYMSSIVEDKVQMEKKIFDKWTQKDKDGNPVKAKDDNGDEIQDAILLTDVDSFSKEMSDLLNTENDIPFDKIKFEELELKTAKVKDLLKVDFLFD